MIESGADINLQTTNSGRTIFHEVMSSEVSDFGLIDRMVSMGALVNLTDVHGTTPLMDLIRNSDNTLRIHADLTVSGKVSISFLKCSNFVIKSEFFQRLLFDAQNCTGETALWRSMFYGKMDCTSLLLYDNSNTALQTRVQGSLADFVSFRFCICIIKKFIIYFHRCSLSEALDSDPSVSAFLLTLKSDLP